jgi:hypothetical protein
MLACLSTEASAAAADTAIPALTADSLVEVVDPQERINGDAVVGATYVDGDNHVNPTAVFAYIGSKPVGKLTLALVAVDGRYIVNVDYPPPAGSGGWVRLVLHDGKKNNLEGNLARYDNSASQIAASLTDAAGNLYPLRWASGQGSDLVRFYINSERTDAFFFHDTGEGRKLELCTLAPGSAPFKFNRLCDVPASNLAQGQFEIQRRFGARRMPPIPVSLVVPKK